MKFSGLATPRGGDMTSYQREYLLIWD